MSSDRPRFLLIAGYPDSIVRYRGRLLSQIQAAGMEIHVACPELTAEHPERRGLEALGAVVHDIPLQHNAVGLWSELGGFLALLRLVRRVRPTKVLACSNKPILYGLSAAWMAGVPDRYALLSGLGIGFEEEGFNSPLRRVIRLLYRCVMPLVSVVFFQNPDDQALMKELGILRPGNASVVVNGSGVDVSEFAVRPLPERPTFVLVSRLIREKGICEFVDAATQITRRHPQARFLLLGKTDNRPNSITQEQLEAWVGSGVIEYPGFVPDVRPLLAASSVFVLPSYYREGVPRSTLEALSMGRAVITTDSPGCRETVIDGDNGYCVKPRSVEALVDAMEKMIAQPQRVAEMGARSRKLAERRFDVHAVTRAMLGTMGIPVTSPGVDDIVDGAGGVTGHAGRGS
ncbi:MAG TPA: glycosyltransferase family 4 protein [Solimonas sp.]|nr:glycosyltransferase family 4 protein [Solimonas sp.]